MKYQRKKRTRGIVQSSYSIVRGGFSLVEMLFYVALLSLCLVVVMQTLSAVTRSFGVLRTVQRIEQEASLSLDRMLREIRDANDINDVASVFGAHPGALYLLTTNALGVPRTVEFFLTNGQLILREDGSPQTGALTSSKTTVTRLIFRKINTVRSKGVRIEMTLQSGTGQNTRSENFYTTAVLRDSY